MKLFLLCVIIGVHTIQIPNKTRRIFFTHSNSLSMYNELSAFTELNTSQITESQVMQKGLCQYN